MRGDGFIRAVGLRVLPLTQHGERLECKYVTPLDDKHTRVRIDIPTKLASWCDVFPNFTEPLLP